MRTHRRSHRVSQSAIQFHKSLALKNWSREKERDYSIQLNLNIQPNNFNFPNNSNNCNYYLQNFQETFIYFVLSFPFISHYEISPFFLSQIPFNPSSHHLVFCVYVLFKYYHRWKWFNISKSEKHTYISIYVNKSDVKIYVCCVVCVFLLKFVIPIFILLICCNNKRDKMPLTDAENIINETSRKFYIYLFSY